MAAPLAQDYTVVFHNPDPEYYVEGCGLVRLDDGALVAVVPVVPRAAWSQTRRVEHSRTHIVRSTDGGKTWHLVAQLPYYSAAPWLHRGALYLFANKGGTKYRNDDLLLLRSGDGGKTWSEPVTLFTGHFWNCHTGMVIRDHQLARATVVAGDLSADPMDPRAWRMSNPVPFPGVPDALTNPEFAALTSQYLEPNVIEVRGQLRVLATVKPKRQSTAGLCAVLDLNDAGKKLDLKFTQFHPMPGGQLKFCVIRDDVSRLFWATANQVVDDQGAFDWWEAGEKRGNFNGAGRIGGNDRRFLTLLYSLDGLNWFQAGCVAQAGKISQSFMYARPVIDGDDLAIISRSSLTAPNQHDADCATFHRVRDFRRLALKLEPDAENP
ncbi:MAG: sialidase family protein [Kiritimatiellaeota bacterium]|nr:sialidase family protein [Kiritimatiellota bacterium]